MSSVQRLVSSRLTLDGTDFTLDVDPHDAEHVYLPLARHIAESVEKVGGERYLCGLAGPPGSGKSASATILAAALNIVAPNLGTQVCPLDGYHFRNEYLDSHSADIPGRGVVNLRKIKGHWATFRVDRLIDDLHRVKAGDDVPLPIYSRELHEPVEGALRIDASCRVVIVEGNYLYLDADRWTAVRDLLDVRVFITGPREVLEAQLLERHRRGGRSESDALRQVREVDLPNIAEVVETESRASVIVRGRRGNMSLHGV